LTKSILPMYSGPHSSGRSELIPHVTAILGHLESRYVTASDLEPHRFGLTDVKAWTGNGEAGAQQDANSSPLGPAVAHTRFLLTMSPR
jgi:hypothetical protein